MPDRRSFLVTSLAAALGPSPLGAASTREPAFLTRGVVLVPADLTLEDWPDRAHQAGLTTIGLHDGHSPRTVVEWLRTDAGQRFLEACRRLGLAVEYELHAMRELLPRDLFEKNPEFFRVDRNGDRNSDSNACAHSEGALEVIAENAVALADVLRPTTGRYFYWGDDNQP
jgi:hypothetical protein